jgi:Transposase DDE domain
MSIVTRVGATLQRLFGPLAQEAGQETQVIVRQRKFTCFSLARTFILGFLHKPQATDEQLAQIAVQAGTDVTPQAVAQRKTPQLVQFLENLFRKAANLIVASDRALAPLLERFSSVTMLDSTGITLPDSESQRFPGCGGSYNGGAAAMKLQTEFDLRRGALTHIEIEPGRSPDGASSRQQAMPPVGGLRITDLGYFCVAVFAAIVAAQAHFLSRLQFGTKVMLRNGLGIDLLKWLPQRTGHYVDVEILLGASERLPCRLVAWRLPEEQANRRRQKLCKDLRDKGKPEPSAERLAWCDWTILITSLSTAQLTPPEAVILYRARWQIELLFKRWKSQDLVAVLSGSTDVAQMVGVWSRLSAALVQHWLVVCSAWGDALRSWVKVTEATRAFVGRLLSALDDVMDLERVLNDLCKVVGKTCRRNTRTKAGTVELLNDPSRLDFC